LKFSLVEILNSLQNFWKKLSRQQKIVLAVIPLIVAGTLFSVIFWASRPNYVPLFTDQLDTASAGSITEKLKELKIDYQLADNGTSVLVPQKNVSEVRLQLANAGLPQQSTFSFENLDQVRIGETDADRKLRYVLGLQNELEQTIGTLEGVEYARVHIVMPEETLFSEDQNDTTAAVTIKTAYGKEMQEDQVRAVANLLAYSVEGLKSDKVVIVDTNGNVLSDELGTGNSIQKLTSDQLRIQQAMQDRLGQSVQTMLDKVFGTGNTIVRTNALLDFDQKKITSQRSEDGAVTSRQETSEKSSSTSATGGVPGTTSNIPGYPVTGENGTTSTSEKTTLAEVFQPGVVQEETVVSPGQIKRLTVSVLADADSVTEEQVSEISGIVSSAVGIDENRGDLVQVARLAFNKTMQLEEQAAMAEMARKDQIYFFAGIGAALLAAIIFIVILLRLKSRNKRDADGIEIPKSQSLVTLEEAEKILLAQLDAERMADLKLARKKVRTSEEIEKEKVLKEVEKYTEGNPDDAARLVKAWLTEE